MIILPPPMRTEIQGSSWWAIGCFVALAVGGLALVAWVIVERVIGAH